MSDVVLTKTVAGTQKQVTVFTTKLEHIHQKNLNLLQIPTTKTKRDSQDPIMKILDLKLIKETYAITGYLETTSTYSALQQKNDILAMLRAAGTITVTVEGSDVSCNCERMKFTHIPMDEDPASKIMVEMSMVKGEDL